MKLNRHKNYQIVSLICDVSNVDFVEVKNRRRVTRGNLGSGSKESFVSAFKVIEKNNHLLCYFEHRLHILYYTFQTATSKASVIRKFDVGGLVICLCVTFIR